MPTAMRRATRTAGASGSRRARTPVITAVAAIAPGPLGSGAFFLRSAVRSKATRLSIPTLRPAARRRP